MTKPNRLAVFCDFDGTVSTRDVGYRLFHHFSGGRNDALLPDWKAGRLTTRDCLVLEAEMVKASAEDIYAFIEQFEIDPTFPRFVKFCAGHTVPLAILSEGMDLYIKRLLELQGLGSLPVYCNRGVLADGRLKMEFPYLAKTCEGCGNCKAQRIKEYRAAVGGEIRIIFVGDGYSDACGAREADVIFAKKDLQQYCDDEGIGYNSFDNFDDVSEQMIAGGLLAP